MDDGKLYNGTKHRALALSLLSFATLTSDCRQGLRLRPKTLAKIAKNIIQQ